MKWTDQITNFNFYFYSSHATFLTQRRGVYEISVRRSIYSGPTDLSFGPYWGNFKWPYLCEGSSDPLHVWFSSGVFEVGGSNGAISGFAKSKMAPPSWKIQMAISQRRIVRFTPCLVLGWGFSGSADRMVLILF